MSASTRADTYDDSAAHRWQAGVAAEVAGVSPAERILDVASGTGLLLRALSSPSPTASRVGVDIASGLLEVAAHQLPGAHWLRADASALPFRDGTFDVLTCVAGITYLPPEAVLPEWRRVLAATGRIVVSMPADRGLTPFALLQDAARTASPSQSPTLGWAVAPRSRRPAGGTGLSCVSLSRRPYFEPLTGRAEDVFDHHLQRGLAEPLRKAESSLRHSVLAAFRPRWREAVEDGLGQQVLLFASWTPT